jgi:hypothetical protein
MQSSRYIATFESEVEKWVKSLANITDVLTISAAFRSDSCRFIAILLRKISVASDKDGRGTVGLY